MKRFQLLLPAMFAFCLLPLQGQSAPEAPATPEQMLLSAKTGAEAEAALAAGANLEACDKLGMTALNQAASQGNLELAQTLLVHKANVETRNVEKVTPLIWAAANGHLEMVRLLADHGAKLDDKDKNGFTALHWAGTNHASKIVVELLQRGATLAFMERHHNPVQHGYYDWPALAIAAGEGNLEAVLLLLDSGVSTEICYDNRPPLHHAIWHNRVEVAQLLIERGADMEAPDTERMTLLMHAADAGHLEIVQLLLVKGARVNAHDKQGHSALYYARRKRNADVIRLLEAHGAKE